ncbi:hypothetical protein LJB42_000600 [Komagataella kurtzmanii]|nr:hypothetical protein LJB42_000600 [Komagataella kurtzmanii]
MYSSRISSPNTPVQVPENGTLVGQLYQVIKDFNARLGDELTLTRGEQVEVISDDSEYNDGWYLGKNLSTGQVGLYPKDFTKIIQNDSHRPSLLRSRSRKMQSSNNSSFASTPNFQPFPKFPKASGTPNSGGNSVSQELDSVSELQNMSQGREDYTSTTVNGSGLEQRQSSVKKTMNDIDRALEELTAEKASTPKFSSSPLNNKLNPLDVEQWTPEDVTTYFSSLNFDVQSAGQFARHKINGSILLQLELSYLKELDIQSFGTRFEIFKEIEKLRRLQKNSRNIRTPQPETPRHDQNSHPFTPYHERKRSQSMDQAFATPNYPLKSVSIAPPPISPPKVPHSAESSTPESPGGDFTSPRRAPEPPIEPPQVSYRSYQFGANPATPNNTQTPPLLPHQRKFSHSRAASSLYTFETNHQRNVSSVSQRSQLQTPGSRVHSRNPSESQRRKSSVDIKDKTHIRYSSVFSFMSNNASTPHLNPDNEPVSKRSSLINALTSPSKISLLRYKEAKGKKNGADDLTTFSDANDDSNSADTSVLELKSPKINRRSVSAKESSNNSASITSDLEKESTKRTVSDVRPKPLTKTLTYRKKSQTSAFQEGIRMVTPQEASKTADFSGWMSKKGSLGQWKHRYFTLHHTRLSYFSSLKDTQEKGLIDITSHKVLPSKETDDTFSALYAATTGKGNYFFKLVPPAPGSRKGLTFTQQKIHYFALETRDDLRKWMAALMKATIELDESIPVISSCATPTVSLDKAQEILARNREYAMLKDMELEEEGKALDERESTPNSKAQDKAGENSSLKTDDNLDDFGFITLSPVDPSLGSLTVDDSAKGLNDSKDALRNSGPDVDSVNTSTESPLITKPKMRISTTSPLATGALISPKSVQGSFDSDVSSPRTHSLRQNGRATPTVTMLEPPVIPGLDKKEKNGSGMLSGVRRVVSNKRFNK